MVHHKVIETGQKISSWKPLSGVSLRRILKTPYSSHRLSLARQRPEMLPACSLYATRLTEDLLSIIGSSRT